MMATIQFYQNKYYYPHYSDTITAYGPVMDCTPVGMNLRSGELHVAGDMSDFMECNYMEFTRDNHTVYAWVDDVRPNTANSFIVSYEVDAWRTYKDSIDLGAQFIARRPEPTSQPDPLLGSEQDYPDIESNTEFFTNPNNRVFVVQVRPQGGTHSSSPVQPTPYQFYVLEYSTSNWMDSQPLVDLMIALAGSPETENLVTMYSIPYMDMSNLLTTDLVINYPDGGSDTITGFKIVDNVDNVSHMLAEEVPLSFSNTDDLLRSDHSIQLVIPDAGVLDVSDELLMKPNLKLRRDIDLFSGACNYMLMSTDSDGQDHYYADSIRGSSISSIPILSDPLETYMSQNQNALATSLIGDVASIAGGAAMTGISGGAGGFVGGGAIASGASGLMSRFAASRDAGNKFSNPPAFLGTATAGYFSNMFWVVTTKQPVDNMQLVHDNYGYQYNKVGNLVFPSSGFIQTEGCNVTSTDGTVPRWAIQEINGMFDGGVHVH